MPQKMDKCVQALLAQGKSKDSAFAICTAAMKKMDKAGTGAQESAAMVSGEEEMKKKCAEMPDPAMRKKCEDEAKAEKMTKGHESAAYVRENDIVFLVNTEDFAIEEVAKDEVPAGVEIEEVAARPEPSEGEEVVPTVAVPGTPDAEAPVQESTVAEPAPVTEPGIRTLYVGESVTLTESVVDATAKTVEVTLIKPGWSANHRYYSKETLAKAMPMFEGVKAYADHPTLSEDRELPERSVLAITGYYKNVRQADDGSLRATRHFVGRRGDEIYPLVVEAVANKPDLIGLSINALGKTRVGEAEGQKGVIVESIVKANSVDDVTTPSAGGRYDRLIQSGDEFTVDLLKHLEYEEWREARPEFAARIKTEMRTARKEELEVAAIQEAKTLRETVTARDTRVQELEAEVNRTQKELSDMQAQTALRESERWADQKLAASKLPPEWLGAVRPQLLGKSPKDMDTVIEAELVKFHALKIPVRVSENGGAPLTRENVKDERVGQMLQVLGVDASQPLIREGESPEQWSARRKRAGR